MGRRGPPPMSDAMRKTRGRRHRKKEPPVPKLPVGAPEMPDNIRQDKRAAAAWTRFTKDLLEMGVLHPSQWAALAVLCESYATAEEMAERLRKDGILVKTSRGKLYTHPGVRIQKQAWAQFLRCAQEFGLTPMAGLRVRANVSPEVAKGLQAKNDDEEFLFGSRGRVVGTIGKKDK